MHELPRRPARETSVFRAGSHSWELGRRTLVVGILNVTPDSFSDGGRYTAHEEIERRIAQIAEEGADLIDIGGESTRPGAAPVDVEDEWLRIHPALRAARRCKNPLPISVDTMKPEVARRSLEEGAVVINDVSGLRGGGAESRVVAGGEHGTSEIAASAGKGGGEPLGEAEPGIPESAPRARKGSGEFSGHAGSGSAEIVAGARNGSPEFSGHAGSGTAEIVARARNGSPEFSGHAGSGIAEIVARAGAGLILMHMKGGPRTMQIDPKYEDLIAEVRLALAESVGIAERAGVPRERILVDPGIGFGKTVEHNLELVRNAGRFSGLGAGVLVGASRKSFIGKLLGDLPVNERLEGSLAAAVAAVLSGAHAVRVHDVRATVRAVRIADAILQSR